MDEQIKKFYMYILFSETRDRYYIGSSDDVQRRLQDHNTGRSKSTKTGRPWILAYSETFATRSLAVKREMEVKRKKSRNYIQWLINNAKPNSD
ncbi:MAG: GIY-YIG nuclease family protein [Saprospiraceae bacterium]|nr:GIY-YIG nuclease family protein [Saprospiraceae bacterium]